MHLDDYKVRLDAFEGPLDLLLFLIKRAEVDLHDIPIAQITEQYLALLTSLRTDPAARIDVDLAAEFLVMAATLTEIKSRMLARERLPRRDSPTSDDAPPDDPRADLVRQLIDYKRFRDAGDALERRADDWRRRFSAAPAAFADDALRDALRAQADDVDLDDLDLLDLAEAFARIAETVNFDRLGDHQVTYDDTPIEVHAEEILARLREPREPTPTQGVPLVTILRGRPRHEMIGLFLALLELVRTRRAGVRIDPDAQVHVFPREPEEIVPGVAPAAREPDAP